MSDARRTGPALEAMYRFQVWLVPTVEKFPRSQKFLLGDRIQATALDVLERLIDATYTRARDRLLGDANLGIEKLRFLIRFAMDLRCLDPRRYEHAARSLDEVGRLVGGWRKTKPETETQTPASAWPARLYARAGGSTDPPGARGCVQGRS
ncbi:MAG: diversity-generating retroelement protein Avd [Alphaproteobacteria bacterium]|nr:diversity-generating retroelement protein Avd [Alphaproteobacteria bacterium]